jgi:hypothetical protein
VSECDQPQPFDGRRIERERESEKRKEGRGIVIRRHFKRVQTENVLLRRLPGLCLLVLLVHAKNEINSKIHSLRIRQKGHSVNAYRDITDIYSEDVRNIHTEKCYISDKGRWYIKLLIFQDLPYSFIAYFPYFEKLRKGL